MTSLQPKPPPQTEGTRRLSLDHLPLELLHRIFRKVHATHETYELMSLGSVNTKLRVAVERYPWSQADYYGREICHLPPPKSSSEWLYAVRDLRSRSRATCGLPGLSSSTPAHYVEAKRPIAALTKLPARLADFSLSDLEMAAAALSLAHRSEEAVVMENHLQLNTRLMRAIWRGDSEGVGQAVALGGRANLVTLRASFLDGQPDTFFVWHGPRSLPQNSPVARGLAALALTLSKSDDQVGLTHVFDLPVCLPASVLAPAWRGLRAPTSEHFFKFGEVIGESAEAYEVLRASLGHAHHRALAVKYFGDHLCKSKAGLPRGMRQALSVPEIFRDLEASDLFAIGHACQQQVHAYHKIRGRTAVTLDVYLQMRSEARAFAVGDPGCLDVSRLMEKMFAAGLLGGIGCLPEASASVATFVAHGGAMHFSFVARHLPRLLAAQAGRKPRSGDVSKARRERFVRTVEMLAAAGALRPCPERARALLAAPSAGHAPLESQMRERLAAALRDAENRPVSSSPPGGSQVTQKNFHTPSGA